MGLNLENIPSDSNNKMTSKISGTGENRSYISGAPAPSSANKRFTEDRSIQKDEKRSRNK